MPEIQKDLWKEMDEYVALPAAAVQVARPELQAPPSLEVFHAWINAATLADGERLLKENPGLLHPTVDAMHLGLAEKQTNALARDHILHKRLPLIQRCREIGVRLALAEVANQSSLVAASIPEFEVPQEDLQAYSEAMEKGDQARVTELLASSPKLCAFVDLPDTIMTLLDASTPIETQRILEHHTELFLPAADNWLAQLAERQHQAAARRKVQLFRVLIAKCRQLGIAEGVAAMIGSVRRPVN